MDVPQLILVTVYKGGYRYMYKLAELLKKPGALKPIETILTPGKQSIDFTPVEIVSTYSLAYLPKLTKLQPLVVPADMTPSIVAEMPVNNPPIAKFNFEIPSRSSKLNQLPQPLTSESYNSYLKHLNTSISNALKPEEKKKVDDYLKNKKLILSKEISKTAFAAWIQKAPLASLYLYSVAVSGNSTDVLAANNFSAFLMMSGFPEKSIPILEYWNIKKPREPNLLCNLGNAYYRLGAVDKAMNYLNECVKYDTLNPIANKILCLLYLKKGELKRAEEHATKSVTACHDEQMIAVLRQLNSKAKPGDIMSLLPATEFPMLKRIFLPAMPSSLDQMEQFAIDLDAEKKSIIITIAAIEAKMPNINEDVSQKLLMESFTKGMSPLRMKAQFIIMDGLQTYHTEMSRESDVFKHNLKQLNRPFNLNVNAIIKKYSELMKNLTDGEGGENEEIDALELAKCKEINAEKESYLVGLSLLVNSYAQRSEYISRKFYRDYANWAPYWVPESSISFKSIERDYLKDIAGILSEYKIVEKSDCSAFEPLPGKEGELQKWEDEFCANFKGKIGMGVIAVTWNCNSWGIEGGEGVVGEIEANYNDDGSFSYFVIGGGLGESWNIGGDYTGIEAGISVKEFLKIGTNNLTGDWEVQDFGIKTEAAIEANILNVASEMKIIELSVAVNAGLDAGGMVGQMTNLGDRLKL